MHSREYHVRVIEKDLIALNDYLAQTNVVAKTSIRRIAVILFVMGGIGVWAIARGNVSFGVFSLTIAVLYWALRPSLAKNARRRVLTKLIHTGKTGWLLGERTITIDPEMILVNCEAGYLGMYWHAVDRIAVTTEHAFIFTSAITAIVLPHRELGDHEFEEFVRLANSFSDEMTEKIPRA